MRRGAIQTLAKSGAAAKLLLTFSGHSSVAMLETYLGFGLLLEQQAKAQRTAANSLLTSDGPQHIQFLDLEGQP